MNQVTDHLWIGDIHDIQQGDTSRFDAIVTICQDNVSDNTGADHYNHFPLSDGPPPEDAYNPGEFNYELFENAVETVIDHVENDRVTLVHCHAGQSRSAMAITAALTELAGQDFDAAFTTVADSRSISPSQSLRGFAKRYADQPTGTAD